MAIRNIRVMGDPCLYQRAKEIEFTQASESFIRQIITDLIDTLKDAGGIGIAAPQIGLPLRIIVLNIDENRANAEHCTPIYFEAHINPKITVSEEDTVENLEACLSLPGLAGTVSRSKRIIFESYDYQGKHSTYDVNNLIARVVQHEIDHLDGQLYWSKIKNLSKFGFIEHMLSPEQLKAKKHLIDKQRAILLNIEPALQQ